MSSIYVVAALVGFFLFTFFIGLWRWYVNRRLVRAARDYTPPGFIHTQAQATPTNVATSGPSWDEMQLQRFQPPPSYPSGAVVASAPEDQPPAYEFCDPELNREVEESRRARTRQEPIFAAIIIAIPGPGRGPPNSSRHSERPEFETSSVSPREADHHDDHLLTHFERQYEYKQQQSDNILEQKRRQLQAAIDSHERQNESYSSELERGYADLEREVERARRELQNKKRTFDTQQYSAGRQREWDDAIRDYERKQESLRRTQENLERKRKQFDSTLMASKARIQRDREQFERESAQIRRELQEIREQIRVQRNLQR